MSAPEVGARLGHPRIHLHRTDSTNERARALAIGGAPHGTLITAAEQSAGRGRQGRAWSAPPGSSLLMSLLLRPPPDLLPLIAAVATCDALSAYTGTGTGTGTEAMIKWPNDIVLDSPHGLAKLAGILVEGRPQEGWAVLGMGVNVAVELERLPPDVRARAATLGGRPRDVEPLLAELLSALERRLAQPTDELLAAWSARDVLRGRTVRWGVPGHGDTSERRDGLGHQDTHGQGGPAGYSEGTAQGIDGAGRLVVALPAGGQTTLEAGEVHLAPVTC